MKTITVRQIPREVAEELRRRSREKGASLSRTVVRVLEEATGHAPRPDMPARHHDLDDLCGSWSEEEAAEFDAALGETRAVDPEMWK